MTIIKNLQLLNRAPRIKNNRKTTRGRKRQVITEAVEILAARPMSFEVHKARTFDGKPDPILGTFTVSKQGKARRRKRIRFTNIQKGDLLRVERTSTEIIHTRPSPKLKEEEENKEENHD